MLVAFGALVFLWWHSRPLNLNHTAAVPPGLQDTKGTTPRQPAPADLHTPATEAASNSATDSVASVPPPASPAAAVAPLPPELASLEPATVLQNMRTSIRQYGAMFGGNPVGTNLEITQALQGNNPKHINFLKADGNRVNGQGELVDVWGTPYFFHQISGTEMEIRSAGPDRIMYTSDDLVIK